MKGDIREYARLGLVHHLLYGAVPEKPLEHAATLRHFLRAYAIETFDCCLPVAPGDWSTLVKEIAGCGREVCFATHFYPLRDLPLAAKDDDAKRKRDVLLKPMIAQARSVGATGFIFGAGRPSFPDATQADFDAFDDFLDSLCPELEAFGAAALLEPFDYDIDKAFLYGPVSACRALAERTLKRHRNFGFELDMAHLPLMHEPFAPAIRELAPYLRRVHLGNCVEIPGCDRYGDTHPPMEFPNGSIGEPELAEILRALLECGFLDRNDRKGLVLEMTPFPGVTPEETCRRSFDLLRRTWKNV